MIETPRSAAMKDAPHADALAPHTRLAEFEILSVLGVGGFGVVYKAFDHSLHRAVAIKEYLPLALAGRAEGLSVSVRTLSDGPAFQSGLKSFVGEARLLAQFDHPSLVKVFRFWEAHQTAYMVMPLYHGMTLKQARAQMRTPPSEAWLRQVLWSVLGALHTLHDSQTLHRDISPDNIFLQDVGPPVLLDLGAARHAINDRDHKHTAVLKVNYAPIEQYADGDTELAQGPWSDLYSLAAVVHGCLCNDTPLPSTLRSIRDRMVPFTRVAKTVQTQFGQAYSPGFVAAIAQSLALQPQDRPQSIDAFLQTMGMVSPPAALEYFDFRAELGDIWVEPTDQPGPGLVTPTVDLTNALLGQLSHRHSPRRAQAPLSAAPELAPQPKPEPPPQALPNPTPLLAAPSRPDFLPAVAPVLPHPIAHTDATGVIDITDFALAPASSIAPAHAPDSAAESAEGTVFLDASDTQMMDVLEHSSAAPLQPPAPADPPVKPPSQRTQPAQRARTGVLAGVAAALLLAAALGYGWMARTPTPPQDTMPTEMAEGAAMTAALSAAQETAAREELLEEEILEDSALPGAPQGPLPAFVEASAVPAASAPQPAAEPRRKAKAAPAPAPLATLSPAPAPKPASAPAPAPRPEPAKQLCADTNFFTRSACVYSECAKPANARLSMCIEHRSRLQKASNTTYGN